MNPKNRIARSRVFSCPRLIILGHWFGRLKRPAIQRNHASTMMAKPYMVTAAAIENLLMKQLKISRVSNDPPNAGRLLEEIIEHFKAYTALLEEPRQSWYLNIDRLTSIYSWGYNIGLLVQIFEENIGEYMKVGRQLYDFHAQLDEYYGIVEKKLKEANVDPDYKHIPEVSKVLMKELIKLHVMPTTQSEIDFHGKYEKYNVSHDFENVYRTFKKNMLQYKEVQFTAVFYAYNLAILIMFRLGLQQGKLTGNNERKELTMKRELVQIGTAWGKIFYELNALIDS